MWKLSKQINCAEIISLTYFELLKTPIYLQPIQTFFWKFEKCLEITCVFIKQKFIQKGSEGGAD